MDDTGRHHFRASILIFRACSVELVNVLKPEVLQLFHIHTSRHPRRGYCGVAETPKVNQPTGSCFLCTR